MWRVVSASIGVCGKEAWKPTFVAEDGEPDFAPCGGRADDS